MFGKEFKIGKIFNILITIDYSWLVIFVLIAFSFGNTFLLLLPKTPFISIVAFGLIASLLFFGSVLSHEIAHTLVARKFGIATRKITLFLFGGVSNIVDEPRTPKAELQMAIAGPTLSFVFGVVFYAVSLFRQPNLTFLLFQLLGVTNIFLAIFNLLPGFPLDGGRILRALIWRKIGNLEKATYYSSLSGQVIAGFLIVGGILQLLFTGSFSSLWLVIVGYFLYQMAKNSFLQYKITRQLRDVKVSDLMMKNPPKISTDLLSAEIAGKTLLDLGPYCLAYKGDNMNDIIGVLDVVLFKKSKDLGKSILPINQLPIMQEDDSAEKALSYLVQSPIAAVYSKGVFKGILTTYDLGTFINSQTENISTDNTMGS